MLDMEDMQFKEMMEQFKEMNQELKLEMRKEVNELRQEINLKFMEVINKIDENQEINSRQHANIYELIESRFQEGKKDREDLHQGQSALDFKIGNIKENLNII